MRLVAAPTMEASGVRKSWLIEASRMLRTRSVSAAVRVAVISRDSMARPGSRPPGSRPATAPRRAAPPRTRSTISGPRRPARIEGHSREGAEAEDEEDDVGHGVCLLVVRTAEGTTKWHQGSIRSSAPPHKDVIRNCLRRSLPGSPRERACNTRANLPWAPRRLLRRLCDSASCPQGKSKSTPTCPAAAPRGVRAVPPSSGRRWRSPP